MFLTKKMSKFKDLMILLICFIIFVNIIIGAIILALLKRNKICSTQICVSEAAKLLNTIDESVSPCDDFYQFSCGKWIQNTKLPEHKSGVFRFKELQDEISRKIRDLIDKIDVRTESREFIRNIKNFYNSCVNTTRLEELGEKQLNELIGRLGGWPIVAQNTWKEVDWTDIYVKLSEQTLSSYVLFSINIRTDLMDNNQRIIILDQPWYVLGGRDSLLKPENDSSIKAYKTLIVRSALKLGAKQNIDSSVDEIFKLEKNLAMNSMAKELRRNWTAVYNKITIKDLIKLAPNINWLKIIRSNVMESITEDEVIVLLDKQYIKFLNENLPYYDNRAIYSIMDKLNEEWLQLKDQFDFVILGSEKRAPRWQMCMESTQASMRLGISHLYIKNYFSSDNREKVSQIFKNVINEFRRSLKINTWMGGKTKEEALQKLDKMKLMNAYPEELMDELNLVKYYQGLKITSSDYFGNDIQVKQFNQKQLSTKLRETDNQFDWRDVKNLALVNIYYQFDKNLVGIPAAFLQGVYFNKDRPNYLNYGSLGFFCGHEIIHGFDDENRQLDSKGKIRNWWDNKQEQLYKTKAKCFISQYSNYIMKEVGQQLNGVNTQGENIADNGGILQAYKAYLNYVEQNGQEPFLPALDYTPDQMFWISFGVQFCSKTTKEELKNLILPDRHSPDKARVNLVVSNSFEFSKSFKCPLGSHMNPVNKCKIW